MIQRRSPKIFFVVPCFNEAECLPETTKRLTKKLTALTKARKISAQSKIVYVDDGSSDRTWEIISSLDSRIIGLKLAHNAGHQNALLAGLLYAKDYCDAAISLDADLQDDINVIDQFIAKFTSGAEIVYGVRNERKKDTFFKRHTALAFYKLMNLLGAHTIYNHADYRLMSQRALTELAKFKEVNLFLRGIVPLLGFSTAIVEYKRSERFAGKSKYPLSKMLNFAVDGITSFSVKPIRLIFSLGLLVSVISLGVLIYAIIVKCLGRAISGWTFTVCSIWLLGGIQMVALGVIGEYIGKIYTEVKARPRYIIETIKGDKTHDRKI